MKKIIRRSLVAGMMALLFTACGSGSVENSGPMADKVIGSNPGDLEKRIEALVKKAGADLKTVEFAEINTSYNQLGLKPSLNVHIDIVNPENPNKLLRLTWYDEEGNRNNYDSDELLLTDSDNNVIEDHAMFADMLFTYADVKTYIDNSPIYCTEGLEACGYKENGFVERLDIEREASEGYKLLGRVRVGYNGQSTMRKSYRIAADGGHIIRK